MESVNLTIDQETLDSLALSETLSETVTGGLSVADLQGMLAIVYLVVAVLGVIFLVLFLTAAVIRFREHRATMGMRKDIQAIRELLEKNLGDRASSRDTVLLADDSVRSDSNIS